MANEIAISADKTRQLLHISKRKCAWMLKNGIIPFKISGKKTWCYEVRLSDLEKFVNDSAKHPEDYIIPSIFSSKPSPISERYDPTPPEDFRPWLSDYWYTLPEMLAPTDIENITGMADRLYVWVRVENSQKERKTQGAAEQVYQRTIIMRRSSPHGKTWGFFMVCFLDHSRLSIRKQPNINKLKEEK